MDNFTWRRVVTFGTEGTETGNFCRPWGVAITRYSDLAGLPSPAWSDYLIAIADRSNNRIQVFKFDAIRLTVTFLHMFGDGPGTRHGQFDRPAGIVFNPVLEHIIVTDKDNHRVQVFDLSGSYLFKFGERGTKSGQFNYPWDIDVCGITHNILVSDTRNRRVQIFDKLGRYLTHFNQPLDSPRGVAYFGPSQVLVSDFNKHRLVLIVRSDDEQVTSSTSLVATSGNNGTDYLTSNNYNNNNNNLLLSNIAQDKAIRRSQYPPPIMQAGKKQQTFYESKFIGFGEGSSWGEFLRPQGVTTNGSSVFCSDSRNNRVVRWNKDTQSFSYISKEIVDLDRPAGLAAIDNYIVIVDFGHNRVHICQNTDMQAF
uniref:Tripartite motif-containing protein 71 n=1 Tax=Aceria tosichella TaxID=561515 RepID=A0A6G1SJU9_9ACAR